jgi:hypothetical protein
MARTALVVRDDDTRADLAEAITNLRAKQLASVIPSTAAEIGEAIDDLLDAYEAAPAD